MTSIHCHISMLTCFLLCACASSTDHQTPSTGELKMKPKTVTISVSLNDRSGRTPEAKDLKEVDARDTVIWEFRDPVPEQTSLKFFTSSGEEIPATKIFSQEPTSTNGFEGHISADPFIPPDGICFYNAFTHDAQPLVPGIRHLGGFKLPCDPVGVH